MTNKLGQRIKELREKNNWSLRELETRININYSVLSRIESGKRPVTDTELLKFSELFDVSTDYLIGRSDSLETQISKKQTTHEFNDSDLQIAFRDAIDFSEESRKQTIDFIKYLKEKEEREGRKPKK
ncbi:MULTISPECIES: helix-turn-helix domain-containing protein [Bacillus]|uniref:helix-turn-helix domain-containing protein n=1 Tax=Bacillus TaxID=1386 RepID=UPI001EFB3119|nr:MULTISPECIES: helix-turn-helix transcriptional regulator [Bacillus]MCE4147422.1 helix-turn-helix transcriptional regulator [Bacillus velezensis]MDV9183912.1 helix-turn-helix transcriptional regulator [Bacillus sp. 31]ULN61936.1 helix-turn-helix transcriptional regulator [Bacillus velezensis]ULN61988.1 helix-turn-helix transcriptional regulator [Bacillus velezensis]